LTQTRKRSWLFIVAAVPIMVSCRNASLETKESRVAPLWSSTDRTTPTAQAVFGTIVKVAQVTDDGFPLATGAPWGISDAPRMPFEIVRLVDVFHSMPEGLGGLHRSVQLGPNGLTPVLRYDDSTGSAVVALIPAAFPLVETAPEFVRRLATEWRVVPSDRASDLADSARVVYVAGGIVGADPPLHALIWAYSDRGFAFILTSTSVEAREVVMRALAGTLTAIEAGTAQGTGPLEARPTCPTNAAGDNLKC
jgi:hypothetical protein